jgi:pSer/pThr/pTyr-binding forkhead associated (FHA) protein
MGFFGSSSGSSSTGPRPSAGITSCPSCGGNVVTGMPFCPSCGKRVRSPLMGPQCPRCGTSAPEGTRYCPACGQDFAGVPQRSVSGATGTPSPYALALLDEAGEVIGRFDLAEGETTVGRDGATLEFADDVFMSPLHAKLTVAGTQVRARDLGSRNGTWVFVSDPHRLEDGDRILVGSQVLEYRRLGYPGPNPPERDATRRMGSLVPSADIACLTQLRADGSARDTIHLSPGRNVRLGREDGDCTFHYDPSMSSSHAEIRSEDADFVVVDLGSRNGVAVSIRGTVELHEGMRMLIGDKMLRLEKKS